MIGQIAAVPLRPFVLGCIHSTDAKNTLRPGVEDQKLTILIGDNHAFTHAVKHAVQDAGLIPQGRFSVGQEGTGCLHRRSQATDFIVAERHWGEGEALCQPAGILLQTLDTADDTGSEEQRGKKAARQAQRHGHRDRRQENLLCPLLPDRPLDPQARLFCPHGGQITAQGGVLAAVANLNAAQEVDAQGATTSTSTATGTGTLLADAATRTILISYITHNVTNATLNGAHIHASPGGPGTNGPVAIGFNQALGANLAFPTFGTQMSDANVSSFFLNYLYFNVHSTNLLCGSGGNTSCSGGEIRGNITPIP